MTRHIPKTALAGLQLIADETVATCITSPPYYGLRRYDIVTQWPAVSYVPMTGLPPVKVKRWKGELGHEPDLSHFIGHLVAVFREVRRVLKSDGVLFVNLGDSYNGTFRKGPNERYQAGQTGTNLRNGLKPKDLMGAPWRLALALQADGWFLRNDIIWFKENASPESAGDRCTRAHEYFFMLSKSRHYHFDQQAIREPVSETRCGSRRTFRGGGGTLHDHVDNWTSQPGDSTGNAVAPLVISEDDENTLGFEIPEAGPATHLIELPEPAEKEPAGWKQGRGRHGTIKTEATEGPPAEPAEPKAQPPTDGLRMKRTVWRVAARGYDGAHSSTFPPDLIRPCVRACSLPGDTILDVFGGTGTTAAVAEEEGRHAIICEPAAACAGMIQDRLKPLQPGLF